MNISFDVNWMTSSFRIQNLELCKLIFEIENFNFYSTNISKICWNFAQNKIFEKSKMSSKIADILWNDYCHSNST